MVGSNPNPSPKSKIQTGPFGAAAKRTKTKLIQNPKSEKKRRVWSLDFGFGQAGTGGDGHVANEDVWPCWTPEFGLVGGGQAWNRKAAGSILPTRGPNWAPISGGGVLPEIGARFPVPCSGNWGPISGETAGQAALLETLGQHRIAPTMCVRASKPSKYTCIYMYTLCTNPVPCYPQSLVQCNKSPGSAADRR